MPAAHCAAGGTPPGDLGHASPGATRTFLRAKAARRTEARSLKTQRLAELLLGRTTSCKSHIGCESPLFVL